MKNLSLTGAPVAIVIRRTTNSFQIDPLPKLQMNRQRRWEGGHHLTSSPIRLSEKLNESVVCRMNHGPIV